MHFGLVMECDYRQGKTQEEAFGEAFTHVELAEKLGIDGVWLAERHFAPPGGPGGIPSVVSSPIVWASAIAARTQRLRVGTAVYVLPLNHPIRIAEEVATVDQISRGRLDLGVGRSGFTRFYEGYNLSYGESRDRFEECLEVLVKAWTQERFSYEGKYYQFHDVCVIPKPYQKPHPPIRTAATTRDTFPIAGRMGMPIFVGVRATSEQDLLPYLQVYRQSWQEAGHPGNGDVMLRIPVYVAETQEQAITEPKESTMRSYSRLAETLARSAGIPGTRASEERAERAERLKGITYEDLLRSRVAYGTPEAVAERLHELIEVLGLSGVIAEMNTGGNIPPERVFNSIRLFGEEVIPRLR